MNKKLLSAAIISALGGLLFGFDTAVISGAEQAIKEVWSLSDKSHGFTISIALIGTIFGALFAGKPGDKYGRRNVLIVLALFYTVSAIGSGLTHNWYGFLFYRFLGGLGVGASSVLGPMYISEISPARMRGRLVAFFQFNVVFGIFLAFLSNFIVNNLIDVDAWRWMLLVETIPAGLFLILLFFIPQSPRWLVKVNRDEEARVILKMMGSKNPENELVEIEKSLEKEKKGKHEHLFSRKYSFPILLAFLVATFNQFTGINAILYYAPRIFELAGLAKDSALIQACTIGFTNMIFTIIAMFTIDRFGRKTLLMIGSVGMFVFLSLVALNFYQNNQDGYSILIYLVGYCAFFAFSQGAVIWVFISEVFPNAVRAKGQSLGSLTHWAWAAVITWLFPIIVGSDNKEAFEMTTGGAVAFTVFAFAMILQLIFVLKLMPETKGKSLEELEKELIKEHS